jgi:peptide/nickel transport system substrate-binding protein
VKANAEALSTKDLTDTRIRPRQFDVIVLQVRLGADPDPFPFWHSTQAKDPGLNISGWNSREADAIIATARATTDQSARGELYARLNTTIARELPAIPLTMERFRYALPKDMKGIRLTYLPDLAARFYDLPNWHLAEQRLWK